MKNEDKNLNSQLSFEEENLNLDQISKSKNNLEIKEGFFKGFDIDLNLSNIINNDNNEIKKENDLENNKYLENESIDFENFDKINITNGNEEESSLHNIQIDLNNKNKNKKIRTKEDLNNTPLPIFDCLYCTNEKIVFQHFINENLSDKYLLQTSIYDINDLDRIISNKRLINKEEKSEKILNLVIKNMEYIKEYISKEKSINYFKSNIFNGLCQKSEFDNHKLFIQKIEDSIVRKKKDFYFKGINKIPKNSINNKCLFNSTNSLINNFNALSGLVEPVPQINANNIKNNFTIGTCSNNSINFNSLSLNNNEFNYYCKDNNNLDYIVEKIEKNEESVNYVDDKEVFLNFFKFDLSRKITKKDLKWENKYYNVWNPDISSDFDDNDIEENNLNIKANNLNIINKENKEQNTNNQYLMPNKIINKSMGYIKYNIPKKNNLIFTFNKNKGKILNKSKYLEINKNKSINFNISNNKNNFKNSINNNKSRNRGINTNSKKTKTNMNINKSYQLKKYPKFSNKFINNYYNYNNNNLDKQNKNLLSSITYLKNLSSSTYNNNINKSANFVGKSRKKINYKINNEQKNISTKSLQYISSTNNDSSTNYSIGISINLKSNSSIKSNGIINCFNQKKISNFIIDKNKSHNNLNYLNKNNPKKTIQNRVKINKLFNNIDILDLNSLRAKSNYNKQKTSRIISKRKNQNQNAKNNFNIYKNNKIFNFTVDKERLDKLISRKNNLFYSSNCIFNNINKKNENDDIYVKSLGLSFGSNDNNISENNTNVILNSISNLNQSKSNLINSKSNYSPNKFNQTYYFIKSGKSIKDKTNNLISLIKFFRFFGRIK